MEKTDDKNLWKFRKAANVSEFDSFVMIVLFIAGVISILQFADWWFREDHISNLPMFIVLSLFIWYSIFRIVLIWANYLRIKKPQSVPVPPDDLRVAVFTTSSPGEPLSMFEKTFEADPGIQFTYAWNRRNIYRQKVYGVATAYGKHCGNWKKEHLLLH